MAISNTHIKQLQLGADQYYLSAKYLLDNSSLEHSYEDIKQLIDEAASMHNLEIKVVSTLPVASINTLNAIYLVPETVTAEQNIYGEYITVKSGSAEPYTYSWEKIGTTSADLSDYSLKTHIHTVTPDSMAVSATATGANVTFNSNKVLGSNATFTTTVTPTTTNIKATASGTTVSSTDASFVNSVSSANASFVDGVTSTNANFVNSVSSSNASFVNAWSASVDSNGVLSFSISSNTAITSVSTSTDKAITGVSTNTNNAVVSVSTSTNNALTSASVSTQPTISLSTGATAGTGVISVATGITSASTTTDSKDEIDAYTAVNVFTQPTIKLNGESSINVASPTQVNSSQDTSNV